MLTCDIYPQIFRVKYLYDSNICITCRNVNLLAGIATHNLKESLVQKK